jgi:hypothetical protein
MREWRPRLTALFGQYGACGVVGGIVASGFAWGLMFAYIWWQQNVWPPSSSFRLPIHANPPESVLLSPVIGHAGAIAVLGMVLWRPRMRHPLLIAVFCASLMGAISLIVATCIMLADDHLQSAKVIRLLMFTVGHMILGAVYGIVLMTLVRWTNRWINPYTRL